MSDKPYVKECSFCKNKIIMSKESGGWLPYELNSDKKHDCRTKQTDTTATNTSKTELTQSDINVLEHVLAKMKLMVK
jgi:hypothetical protein